MKSPPDTPFNARTWRRPLVMAAAVALLGGSSSLAGVQVRTAGAPPGASAGGTLPRTGAPPGPPELLHGIDAPSLRSSFNEGWRWVVFDAAAGLPSSSVHDLVETPAGTVWAATLGGLAWFDGYRWTALDQDQGVPAERPQSISPHRRDEIMAVFGNRLFRGGRDGLEQLPVEVDGTFYQVLAARGAGREGAFVLATRGAEGPAILLYYDGTRFKHLLPRREVKGGEDATGMWSNGRDALWLNTPAALLRWSNGRWDTKVTALGEQPVNVERLVETERDTGLVKIAGPPAARGLWEWTHGGDLVRDESESSDLLEAMDISPRGDALVVFRSGDVRLRENGNWSRIEHVPPQMTGLLFVKFRGNGDLWVGTQHGLFLFGTTLNRWRHWEVTTPDARNDILEILPASDGSLWLGTARGIAVHRPDGTVEWIERVNGVELQGITALAEDEQGGVWIGSGSALPGAYRWDGRSWQHFGAQEGLAAPLVHKIRKDRSGRLWFLGMAPYNGETPHPIEPGAFVLEDGRFTPWTPSEGLLNGRVYDFAEGPDGSLWFATFEGLSRWHQGLWTHWTEDDGLRESRIFTVTVDRANRTWFGDQASGLGYLDEHGRPRYLTTADGLVHDEVQQVRAGPGGELWISTRGGLSCLYHGDWTNFDVTTGMSSPILWPVVPLADRVLVGTSGNGVDVLSLAESRLPPPRVDFEPAVIDESSALLRWSAYTFWGQLTPAATLTRYRVDGGPWEPWSREREAWLPSLSAGEHELEVQAKGILPSVGAPPSGERFSVRPPLYLRGAFLAPTGTLLLLVVVLLVSRRRHSGTLRQRDEEYRRRLEERVDERTEALRESEERLRMLLETAHVIPWVANAGTWEFTYVGPQAVEVLGYPIESWFQADFWQRHIHPDDVDEALSFCALQSERTDRYDFEYRMIAADGRVVWLHDLVAVVTENGSPATLRGFMIDVTARKQAEAERLDAESEALEHRERLAHLSRVNMLGEMATGIAHEVNQPLTAVSTYTQACRRMMAAGLIDTEGIIDVLGRISDEAVRAGDMIHGLKALVRKRRSELRVCNVNDLVRDVIPLAEVEARARGIAIGIELADDLPDVTADDVQVQQVVLNLLRNAIEAAQPAGGRVGIASRAVTHDLIEVQVTDNGAGLEPEVAERIFQPFFSTKQDGMGMGLSISRSIIDAHGGEIGYRQDGAGGSTFFFQLPADAPHPDGTP